MSAHRYFEVPARLVISGDLMAGVVRATITSVSKVTARNSLDQHERDHHLGQLRVRCGRSPVSYTCTYRLPDEPIVVGKRWIERLGRPTPARIAPPTRWVEVAMADLQVGDQVANEPDLITEVRDATPAEAEHVRPAGRAIVVTFGGTGVLQLISSASATLVVYR